MIDGKRTLYNYPPEDLAKGDDFVANEVMERLYFLTDSERRLQWHAVVNLPYDPDRRRLVMWPKKAGKVMRVIDLLEPCTDDQIYIAWYQAGTKNQTVPYNTLRAFFATVIGGDYKDRLTDLSIGWAQSMERDRQDIIAVGQQWLAKIRGRRIPKRPRERGLTGNG